MTALEILQRAGIQVTQRNGKNGTELVCECPVCKRPKKCSVNAASGAWQCWHAECKARGSVHDLAARLRIPTVGRMVEIGGAPPVVPLLFSTAPAFSRLKVDAEAMQYLRGRCLDDLALLERLRIGLAVTGSRKAIAIPHFTAKRLVGVKLRIIDAKDKDDRYRSITGSRWSIFNGECLADAKWAVLCEGELNALSWIAAGIPNAISLGSAGKTDPTPEEMLALEHLDYLVLQYDQDAAGQAAEKELRSRLGAERCRILHFDAELDAKDANEVLVKHGPETLRDSIKQAKPCEIPGVMNVVQALRDLVEQETKRLSGAPDGITFPWKTLSQFIALEPGRLAVLVGHPKTGKTTAALQIATSNASRNLSTLFWCLEMPPTEIVKKIVCQHFERRIDQVPREHFEFFLEHWSEKPLYLGYGALRSPEEAFATLRSAIRVYGTKLLVLDNLHYLVRSVENQSSVLANAMKYLKELVVETGVCLVLIAQPSMQDTNKSLGLYAARGSAAIASDCDMLIVVERENADSDEIAENVAKAAAYDGAVASSNMPTLLRVVANRYGPPGTALLRYVAGEERFVCWKE